MTPDRNELRRILTLRDGSIAEVSFARLLLAHALEERTVTIELRRGALHKEISLEAGAPVECRSNIATETIGRHLVAIGRLTDDEHLGALNAAAGRGIPLEEWLVETKIISASELYKLLQQNLGRRLLDAFTWRSGTFHIGAPSASSETPLRVNPAQLLFTGLLKLEDSETVEREITALRDRRFVLSSEPLLPLNEIRMSPEQQRALSLLKKGATLAELTAATKLSEEDSEQLLYVFLFLGMAEAAAPAEIFIRPALSLELDESLLTEPDTPLQSEKPDIPLQPQIPAEPAAVHREELMAAFMSYRRKDAYELLELEENANSAAVARAFVRFADRFLPTRFGEEDLKHKAQDLFLAGARAYAELADPDRRSALSSRRQGKADEAARIEAERAAAAKAALVDPENLYRQGRELADAGKLREALSYFEMAADIDAQNGNYAAELAWTRYRLLNTPASNTLKTLKNVLRIDPRSGVAHLHTGSIHAILGNRLEAEGYLRKAQSLMPRDRRPGEALRTLLK